MTASDAIKTCFAKWKTFEGRASRSEYWWFAGFVVLGSFVFALIDGVLFGPPAPGAKATQPFGAIFSLIIFLPAFAVLVRRLHDIGKSGWYALLPAAIGVVSILSGIIMGSSAGYMQAQGMTEGMGPGMHMGMPAAFLLLGATGALIAALLTLLIAIAMLYWLTRPSEPRTNQYGPIPQ